MGDAAEEEHAAALEEPRSSRAEAGLHRLKMQLNPELATACFQPLENLKRNLLVSKSFVLSNCCNLYRCYAEAIESDGARDAQLMRAQNAASTGEYSEAIEALRSVSGIGAEPARAAALVALHELEAFCVATPPPKRTTAPLPLLGAACAALLWGAVKKWRRHRRDSNARGQNPTRGGLHDDGGGDDSGSSVAGYTGDACVAGIRRARRHRLVLRGGVGEGGDTLPPLPLDVCIAGPPSAAAAADDEVGLCKLNAVGPDP
jgi:hypothetical protein